MVSALVLAALLAGEPTIRLKHPLEVPSGPPLGQHDAEVLAPMAYGSDALHPPAEIDAPPRPPQTRKLGTNTTLFINFDGAKIHYCNPSNSHDNCSWLEDGSTFAPWSGSLAERVAVLDVLRSLTADYGIRVTGRRPASDEIYTMVVYGGDSIEEEALGRAPAGDCWDDRPNEIAHAYMDGERKGWINGGASTAFHEAAHTWGFDHIGLEASLMSPSGGNVASAPFDGCAGVVEDTALTPAEEPSCPALNLELCGLSGYQHDVALLHLLFGPPYVDDQAPNPELIFPSSGTYFQGPATFDVDIDVDDDLDPQLYEIGITIPGWFDETVWASAYAADFVIDDMPLGTWTIEVRVRDEAGNEGSLSFVVEVGEEPARLDDGCDCRSGSAGGPGLAAMILLLGLARPRRPPRKLRAARA